ncbi:MAG: tRNA (adenosine(37)-N6)-threonylcarbamoyltransferase complex dimerization subunit type 1 TsaB [Bradymonadia bacterium]
MLYLAAETATPYESVALLEDDVLLGERMALHRRGHGPTVLGAIDALLAEAGKTLTDLDGLICGLGPGSFTGLRIALATLKGLAMAHDLPLYGVQTWKALVAALPHDRVLALVDAGRGEVYAAGAGIDEPLVIAPEQVSSHLPAGEPPVLLGSGAVKYRDRWPELIPDCKVPSSAALHVPRAALLYGWIDASSPAPVGTLEPRYVRRSDAEINYPDGFPNALKGG